MSTREEQKEKRRMDILIAGLDLFICRGYSATKISDIAERVGMSAGLLFHYFDSKEKLYEELVKTGLQGTKSVMLAPPTDTVAFFSQIAFGILDYIKDNPYIAKMFVFMAQTQRNESIPNHIRALALEVDNIEQSIAILEEGQRQGVIREGNPRALSVAFWCCLQGIAEQIALEPQTPVPEPAWVLDIILKKTNHEAL